MDLFCGTGSLGIEAISRGAKYCQFVDKSCESVMTNTHLLEHNTYNIVKGDFFKITTSLIKGVDIIFIDPPYGKYVSGYLLDCIANNELIKYNGIIVYEESDKYNFTYNSKNFSLLKTRIYGDTNIYILEAKVGDNISGDL